MNKKKSYKPAMGRPPIPSALRKVPLHASVTQDTHKAVYGWAGGLPRGVKPKPGAVLDRLVAHGINTQFNPNV